MSPRTVPVAVSDRDGDGAAFVLGVAGELRHPVWIKDQLGRVAGTVEPDGWAAWEPPHRLNGSRPSPEAVRRALSRRGRPSAVVDERGVVLVFKVEPRR